MLRLHVKDESVDLVYLDPPFKSDQDYNVLFAEKDGTRSAAQIKAFGDTWRWDQAAAAAYHEIVVAGGQPSLMMQAFRQAIGENDMLAYLSMMAPRLVELRRVLKETGSIYLHCDPTASHYLKLLMDAIFEPANFRNEIVWKRTQAHNDPKRCGGVHDVLLFYARDAKRSKWYGGMHAVSDEYMKSHYSKVDEQGRHYQLVVCHAPGPGPARVFFGRTMEPPEGRHWTWTQENIDKLAAEGRIVETKNGMPRLVQYAPAGVPLQDVWVDIDPLNSQAKERLGYPTQKPEALLERIIQSTSSEGDMLLDPFCGCGTAIAVAEKLHRRWIGIDITYLATTLIKNRLATAFSETAKFEIKGEPTDLAGAKALAESDPYQFQWWALGLVKARPVEQKKGADKGIDGRLFFHDEWAAGGGSTKQIIFSVKAGHLKAEHVRDLRGVIEREKAPIGVLIAMEEPTRDMRREAASAGFYKSPWSQEDYPRLQILTIEELLDGKKIHAPPQSRPEFKAAPKAARKPSHRQKEFDE